MSECGQKMERYARIVGYYRPIDSANNGKREEIKMRKAYDLKKAEADIDNGRSVGLSALTAEGE